VRLVGFIIKKFVTMHGHMKVKFFLHLHNLFYCRLHHAARADASREPQLGVGIGGWVGVGGWGWVAATQFHVHIHKIRIKLDKATPGADITGEGCVNHSGDM
jgi:hypothetical protein